MAISSLLYDLRVHAHLNPNRVAVVCNEQHWTYGKLESLSNRLAHAIRNCGLVRGDHMAVLVGNRPEILALVWAAWRSGVYITPIPTTLTSSELAYMLQDCDAKLFVCDAQFQDAGSGIINNFKSTSLNCFSLGGNIFGYESIEDYLSTLPDNPISNECPGSLMMYTSGTTGVPKGVIRPLLPPDWRGTPPFAADLLNLFEIGGDNVRYLSTQPLYHAAAMRFALAVTAGGGVVYVMERFDAGHALDLIESKKITHSQWVPAMFQRLLRLSDERKNSFRAPTHISAIHGASPCSSALKNAIIDWWGPILLEYYSGSEGVGLTLISSQEAINHPGSVGKVCKGQLHVISDPDSEEELPVGQIGYLYFSGVPPFSYYKAAKKTSERTNRLGWQTLGDMGYVDSDGFVYLTDRMDDMIISGGVNVYPQEIEQAIMKVTGVYDCAVVGIPDDQFGERPVSFVVPESTTDLHELLQRINEYCQQHLSRIKRPDHIELISALPRSQTGKLLRRELRKNYAKADN